VELQDEIGSVACDGECSTVEGQNFDGIVPDRFFRFAGMQPSADACLEREKFIRNDPILAEGERGTTTGAASLFPTIGAILASFLPRELSSALDVSRKLGIDLARRRWRPGWGPARFLELTKGGRGGVTSCITTLPRRDESGCRDHAPFSEIQRV